MRHLVLRSGSRAEDAGYLALADIAGITDDLGVDYRLVGGQMTSLLVAAYGVTGVPERETADADLAAEPAVVADPGLPRLLEERGYRPHGASNRFARATDAGHQAVIDVLAPSPDGRLHSNRRYGDLYLDEIPGLLLALARPPVPVDLEVQLQAGESVRTTVRLPRPAGGARAQGTRLRLTQSGQGCSGRVAPAGRVPRRRRRPRRLGLRLRHPRRRGSGPTP